MIALVLSLGVVVAAGYAAVKVPVSDLTRGHIVLLWALAAGVPCAWWFVLRPPLAEVGSYYTTTPPLDDLPPTVLRSFLSTTVAVSVAEEYLGHSVGRWLLGPFSGLLLLLSPLMAASLSWRWMSMRPAAGIHAQRGQSAVFAAQPQRDFLDEEIGRHFGHHARFAIRHPGRTWTFTVVDVPIRALYCMYDDPGVGDANPQGLMGSVGEDARGHAGRRIAEMADTVRAALAAGSARTDNPSLAKVLMFVGAGVQFTLTRAQPLALSQDHEGRWLVREGTHRAVALALMGESRLRAIHFESAQLLEGAER